MPTTAEVYAPIEAPETAPRPHGLFSVSPPNDGGERWRVGVGMQSYNCMSADTWSDACIGGGAGGAKALQTWDCDVTVFDPFVVLLLSSLSGIDQPVAAAKTSGALEAAEQRAVEGELWTKMLAAATDGGAVATAQVALASVEYALGQNYNGVGAIHLTPYSATMLADYVEVRDGRLVTKACGTPVVVGAGYSPLALDLTVIGTGAVFVRRGELEEYQEWERPTNDIISLAERTYLTGWDCYSIKTTVT